MTVSRREFVTTVSGAGAAINLLGTAACSHSPGSSAEASPLPPLPGFEPTTLRDRINSDGEFKQKGRYWHALVRLEFSESRYDVRISDGQVTEVMASGPSTKPDVTISGSTEVWNRGYLARGLRIEGDSIQHIAPYRGAILRIIANIRALSGQGVAAFSGQEVSRKFDSAIGRYMYVHVHGVQYRIYFEEAGTGIPMLVQHLAGSDGRVWRHLLEDSEIQKHFRMIIYDLPYHGKSLPPSTVPWWTEPYRPTEAFFLDTILSISKGLALDRPVYLGNGIGGYLAPALAYRYPDEVRAIIAVNSGIASSAPLARSHGKVPPTSNEPNVANHPKVGNERHGVAVYEITSPEATEMARREIEWIWRQGAPGVFAGDTAYFANDYDLTDGKAAKIDTSKVGVFLIDGEYYAKDTVGNNGQTLAAEVKGSTYIVSEAGSHPMVDDYPRFRETLIPVLNQIRSKYASRA